MKRTLTLAALISLGAATLAPLPSMAQNVSLVISTAPPAPRYEVVPAPRSGFVWANGYWNWDGHRHVWLGGHWEPVRNGLSYHHSEWVREGNGYRFRQGGWIEVADAGYGEVRIAPPPPRFERVPPGRAGYVWEPGHWEWRHNRHEWIGGAWLVERPGNYYTQSTWIQRDGRWFFEPARWTPGDRNHNGVPDRFEHGRDRDHDGIPDRLEHGRGERDHDHDGGPNRRDHDRDGDGVPNNQDRRPDDPRRN